MNIVDLLKQQLGGEVTKSLSGMAGTSEADLSKILGAALPGLLSGLGSLASSKEGAGKIADAIGGMDSSLFGNLAGMLAGSAGKQGGSMLSSLFGNSVIEGLSAAVSKFTGINQGLVKSVLGYITPLVLGAIGKSLLGAGRIDSASISNLFSQQKSNIASALPKGFSLDGIQGLTSQAKSLATAPAPSGLGKLLLPALALAAVIALFLFWKSKQPAVDTAVDDLNKQGAAVVEKMQEEAGKAADATKSAVAGAADALGGLQGDFTSMFESLTGKLGKISDAASAEDALPDLQGYATKLEGMAKSVGALPSEGKTMILDMIRTQMEKLNPIIEKLNEMPGVSDAVRSVIEQIKNLLTGLLS